MEVLAHLTTNIENGRKFNSPSQAKYAGDQLVAGHKGFSVESKLGKKIVCQITVGGVAHYIAEEPTSVSGEEVANG